MQAVHTDAAGVLLAAGADAAWAGASEPYLFTALRGADALAKVGQDGYLASCRAQQTDTCKDYRHNTVHDMSACLQWCLRCVPWS
jgi:hypothetical protein